MSRKGHKLIVFIFISTFIIGIVICLHSHMFRGIFINDTFLLREDNSRFFADEANQISINRKDDTALCKVVYKDNMYLAEVHWIETDKWPYAEVMLSNGDEYEGQFYNKQLHNSEGIPYEIVMELNADQSKLKEIVIVNAICKSFQDIPEWAFKESISDLLFGSIIYVMGLLIFLFPDAMTYSRTKFSDRERKIYKILAVCIMFMGFVGLLFGDTMRNIKLW